MARSCSVVLSRFVARSTVLVLCRLLARYIKVALLSGLAVLARSYSLVLSNGLAR